MSDTSTGYFWTAVISLAIIAGIYFLIAQGWRGRQKRQQDLITPAHVPQQVLETEPMAAAEGMYVTTVRGRDWLERIAVHGLGVRTTARIEVHPTGVAVLRTGAENLFIPATDLTDVRRESGMNGKFVEKNGLEVISWMLGGEEVSTGFRTRAAADRSPLHTALQSLLTAPTPETAGR